MMRTTLCLKQRSLPFNGHAFVALMGSHRKDERLNEKKENSQKHNASTMRVRVSDAFIESKKRGKNSLMNLIKLLVPPLESFHLLLLFDLINEPKSVLRVIPPARLESTRPACERRALDL
jgi:hypothetical protein